MKEKVVPPAAIILAFLTLVVLIGPVHEFPQADDWDYARTAQALLDTGTLQRSEYSQATVVLHALVGAVVIKLAGFSFTALHLSTLAFALVALLALYALLRELDFDPALSVLGALALMVVPDFVSLGFSFMTDVPALAWIMLALLFYVRGLKRQAARHATLASVFAACAFLVRQTGIILPLAFALVTLWNMPRARWSTWLVAGCALPGAVVALYVLAPGQESLTNWGTQNVTLGMTLAQLRDPAWWGVYLRRAVQSGLWFGFYLLPLSVVLIPQVPRVIRALRVGAPWRVLAFALAAVVMLIVAARLGSSGEWFPYFMRSGMRPYLSYIAGDRGALRGELLPAPIFASFTLMALAGGLGLVGLAVWRIGRPLSLACKFSTVTTALLALATVFFGVWYERYLLPLFPGVIMLVLAAARRWRVAPLPAVPGILLLGVCSWGLMQDYWSWNEARWRVGGELLAQGVAADKIDGGYEWDAWYLYPTAEAYVRETGAAMVYEPWRLVLDPDYLMAFQPTQGYTIRRVVPFSSPFGNSRFYVLQRE